MRHSVSGIADKWRNCCIGVTVFVQVSRSLVLFLFGTVLLTGGLMGISTAQINPPEGAQNQFPAPTIGLPPQPSFAQFPEQAIQQAPQEEDVPYDDTLQRNAVGNLFKFIEGSFGALVMTVAGIGAIVAASMGAYKAAVAILVVAIGAFILRALVSLFFGTNYQDYEVGGVGAVGDLP